MDIEEILITGILFSTIGIAIPGIIALIVGLFIPMLNSDCLIYQTTFDGQHTGTITAIEKSGIIWKTYDVYFKTDTESSQEDTYCVYDPNLIGEIQNFSKNKSKVTLHYDDYLFIGYNLCGSSPIITSVDYEA